MSDFMKDLMKDLFGRYAQNKDNTPIDNNDPAQMEQVWMSELDSLIAEIYNNVNYWAQLIPTVGVSAIQGVVQYLSANIPRLEAFSPKAEELNKAGRNQMSAKLNVVLPDIQKAYQIYLQMYQGGVNHQIELADIWNRSMRDSTKTILETNIETQKAYKRANEKWDDNF